MDSLASRLADAKLGAAIDNAARKLPGECVIQISIMADSATVTLEIDGNVVDYPSNHENLADEINDAVEHAIKSSR